MKFIIFRVDFKSIFINNHYNGLNEGKPSDNNERKQTYNDCERTMEFSIRARAAVSGKLKWHWSVWSDFSAKAFFLFSPWR